MPYCSVSMAPTRSIGQARHAVAPWVERLARLGYASKGTVYVILGLLAAAAGAGLGGETADRRDVLEFILRQPFGRILLLVIAVGLLGYAVWRIGSGVADWERRGASLKGIALRIGSVVRGLAYGGFAVEVIRLVQGHARASGSDASTRHWTQRVMSEPFGRWAVAAAGAIVVGYAVYQLYRGAAAKLGTQLRLERVRPGTRRWIVATSRLGMAARGVVFGVIGGSLVRAAFHHDSRAAKGTSGALREIASQPFGPWLLVLVGVGLAAYGVYAFVNARYRVIRTT
jgi:hypothetical protein